MEIYRIEIRSDRYENVLGELYYKNYERVSEYVQKYFSVSLGYKAKNTIEKMLEWKTPIVGMTIKISKHNLLL